MCMVYLWRNVLTLANHLPSLTWSLIFIIWNVCLFHLILPGYIPVMTPPQSNFYGSQAYLVAKWVNSFFCHSFLEKENAIPELELHVVGKMLSLKDNFFCPDLMHFCLQYCHIIPYDGPMIWHHPFTLCPVFLIYEISHFLLAT